MKLLTLDLPESTKVYFSTNIVSERSTIQIDKLGSLINLIILGFVSKLATSFSNVCYWLTKI